MSEVSRAVGELVARLEAVLEDAVVDDAAVAVAMLAANTIARLGIPIDMFNRRVTLSLGAHEYPYGRFDPQTAHAVDLADRVMLLLNAEPNTDVVMSALTINVAMALVVRGVEPALFEGRYSKLLDEIRAHLERQAAQRAARAPKKSPAS